MDNMLKDYIEAGKALQEKYDEIRRGIVTRQRVLWNSYTSKSTRQRVLWNNYSQRVLVE